MHALKKDINCAPNQLAGLAYYNLINYYLLKIAFGG